MDIHTFKGKRKIGVTDINDFTDFQGIGRDPLYKRYVSVGNLIDKVIDPKYAHFLAVPDYDAENGEIKWYVDIWNETPERLKDLPSDKRARYEKIKEETLGHYKKTLDHLSGEDLQIMACALRYINEDFIYCADGKVYAVAWGMTPDNAKHITMGELVHEAPTRIKIDLTFLAGENGKFLNGEDKMVVSVPQGCVINELDLPAVEGNEGFEFSGYYPNPLGQTATAPMEFKATYRTAAPSGPVPPVAPPEPIEPPRQATVRFDPGPYGTLTGADVIMKPLGSSIIPPEVPTVTPMKGYEFTGWSFNPLNAIISADTTFTALYNKKKAYPWWWWLIGALLAILLALLILFLTGTLKGCGGPKLINGIYPVEEFIIRGDTIEDNGVVRPIAGGKLPRDREFVTAPVRGEDGEMAKIIREPGLPPRFAQRLILFIEDSNAGVDELAEAFKRVYPGDNYSVIGFDRYVKSINIQVPEAERETIKAEINQKIPNINFIVFDETVYDIRQAAGSRPAQASPKGWHLDAVRAAEGWQITKGSPSVVVAVVDDGIDASHSMFGNRITKPYNVYRHSNQLGKGIGHGTMVAGLAVGSLQYQGQGAAGIAPDCGLMPVQVSDNGEVPLSAMISGIMYAAHQGADVINVSIGPQLQGLNILPINDQVEISQTQFLKEQRLWKKVCEVAASKNSILVFAAGNDDILSSIPPENRNSTCCVVGAVDEHLYPTNFTNYGYCTDISAPGTDIYSSYPVNGFNSMDGTSFSAPIVSGAIALMRSLNKNLTVKQANDVLYRTGKGVFGFMPPMVQVPLALKAVKDGDLSRGPDRPFNGVPETAVPRGQDDPYESWTIPATGVVTPGVVAPGGGTTIIDGGGVVGPGGIVVPVDGIDPLTGVVIDPVINPTPGRVPVTPTPGQPATPDRPGVAPAPGQDYNVIREKIKKLKREIQDLEQQLPENQRR